MIRGHSRTECFSDRANDADEEVALGSTKPAEFLACSADEWSHQPAHLHAHQREGEYPCPEDHPGHVLLELPGDVLQGLLRDLLRCDLRRLPSFQILERSSHEEQTEDPS